MENIIPKYRMSTPGSKRTHNNAYYFEINNIRIKVRKKFFMRTLDISSKMIFTTTKKKDDVGVLQVDDRGHHGNGGVNVSDYKKDDIRDHIKSFPYAPSHYTRSRSGQKYLDGSLSISAMYRMYKTKCVEEGKEYAK